MLVKYVWSYHISIAIASYEIGNYYPPMANYININISHWMVQIITKCIANRDNRAINDASQCCLRAMWNYKVANYIAIWKWIDNLTLVD